MLWKLDSLDRFLDSYRKTESEFTCPIVRRVRNRKVGCLIVYVGSRSKSGRPFFGSRTLRRCGGGANKFTGEARDVPKVCPGMGEAKTMGISKLIHGMKGVV